MKNKRILKRIICLLLALILVLPLCACGEKEENLMELDGVSMSMGMYRLMLSIQKGNMAYLINYHYGDYNSSEFWNTVIDKNSTTNNAYYTFAIYQKAKNLLSAVALFEEMKMTLPDSTVKAIDSEMSSFVTEFGGGNRKAFESMLEGYGFTYEDLREYKIWSAKATAVANELYGKDGSKIGAGIKQDYLEENYYAFKQIYLANFYNVYETDENDDIIYYDGNGSVAYDTVNGTPKMGKDGKLVYYTEDGKIAYDQKSGKPSPILDENGYQMTEDYTHEEWLKRLDLAAELIELGSESDATFETLASLYSDDGIAAKTTIYVAKNISYQTLGSSESYIFLDDATEKLAEMKVGELNIIQDESGIHIIRKYALEEGAYAKNEYAGWFKDTVYQVYDFNQNLKNELFGTVLSKYHEKITVDDELLGSTTLRDAVPNYYYH
jgi:hypothetical protein